MGRIHPTQSVSPASQTNGSTPSVRPKSTSSGPSVLTVWKKSSMAFQGTDGFTVFDSKGKLVYRVDNYSRKNRCFTSGGLVLMDATGTPLFTLRPQQILSITEQWNGFEGDVGSKERATSPVFFMRKRSLLQSSDEAQIFFHNNQRPDFTMDGCFQKRHCKIRDANGQVVAEISRKKVNPTVLLSDDVFKLVIGPGYDSKLMMAIVVVMDRICRKPFTPILCS